MQFVYPEDQVTPKLFSDTTRYLPLGHYVRLIISTRTKSWEIGTSVAQRQSRRESAQRLSRTVASHGVT
ncbi:hypothetical protein E2C01_088731 [Portunus trituberculatus]|uniref:Uncharacterized protein n=1 Tax=Portunus trituberculatus TaxID=210409 RepID=A0A5B7JK71_PORTR|nr:hypothetical protein [Portunus trituberculatus]